MTAEEMVSEKKKKEESVIPLDHLEIISKYCTDSERCLLLLGLNCAFGEGEVGQLRVDFIKENEINGVRFEVDPGIRTRKRGF